MLESSGAGGSVRAALRLRFFGSGCYLACAVRALQVDVKLAADTAAWFGTSDVVGPARVLRFCLHALRLCQAGGK